MGGTVSARPGPLAVDQPASIAELRSVLAYVELGG
jgi:hypothetical protein